MKSKMQDTIVLYPSPGMGHIVSMVELGKLILIHYGHQLSIKILLITSKFWDSPVVTDYINTISKSYPDISFHRLPPRSVGDHPPRSRHAKVFELIELNAPDVLQALQEMKETCNINALVLDMFCISAHTGAKNLGVPVYYFFATNAACLAAFLYFPTICKQYTKPFKDLTNTFLHFPSLPSLKAIHVPEPMLNINDPAYDAFLSLCINLSKADGVIVNTFDELEADAIKSLEDGVFVPDAPTPPLYYIGPLLAATGGKQAARHVCLSWLDRQPPESVVFLSFGSRGSLPEEQVKEIATGLEKSGKRFLWVVRNPPADANLKKQVLNIVDFDLDAILPEGFLERVHDRGMVVKLWAPQQEILKHEAIGGFVTHSGWNSVLEAVVAGVPLVAWPLYAEQHMNRNVLVEYMDMAIPVEQRDDEDGFVSGEEVERRVRELMDSEKGKELREKFKKLKASAFGAWGESGSSTVALATLVKTWKRG
ncbi:hypothetical protein Tsubulata_036863 [Turnera subulata]|uniref:Glycosyltransferase n=1 Tax=Turnera subulata TaxID=218843 RepID=A0A9Q0FI74_9ROSI|nr:hypothetical protein Tsubulata_036863 [Turnera subulata]